VFHEELQLKKKKKVTWHGGVLSTAGVPRGITVEEEEEKRIETATRTWHSLSSKRSISGDSMNDILLSDFHVRSNTSRIYQIQIHKENTIITK